MGKVRTRSQSVAKKKPPKKKKSGISKPKSFGKRNPKLRAKSGGGTAAKAASKKGEVSPSEDSNDEDSEREGTETEDHDNDVETTNGDDSSSAEDRKVNANVRAAIVLKNGERAMIHAVTRGAVTVILPLMLLLAEVILHAALVPPPEKIQVKACLLHR